MRTPKINVHKMYSKFNVKTFASKAKKVPQKVIRKAVPATIIVAESLTGLTSHAAGIEKFDPPFKKFLAHGIADWFEPKTNRADYITPLAVKSLTPKNNFKKNSPCLSEQYKGTAEELNYFIDKLIPKKNGSKEYNPFYGKGEAFIKLGKKYNVNPTVLVAIGMQESGRGTSTAACKLKNIGGIYLNNKKAKFEKVEECIEIMASTINKRINENCKSVADVGNSGKYCDKSASDVWIKNVMFFLNKM